MDLIKTIMIPILPLVGVIIGAFIQGRSNNKTKELEQRRNVRNQTYSDYLNGVADVAFSLKGVDSDRYLIALGQLTSAKARILIYGSKKVVELITEFERIGAKISNQEEIDAFIDICQAMRNENLSEKEKISDKDISELIIGKIID